MESIMKNQYLWLPIVLCLLITALPAAGEDGEVLPLLLGVTGTAPGEDTKNPTAILADVGVQRLILEIAESPQTRPVIEEAIAGKFFTLENMIETGLLREEKGLLYIDFNLLLIDDQRAILDVSERYARDLASSFLARRNEFETLANSHAQVVAGDVEVGESLYIVLGCFSLDWDGLVVTRERGYREKAQRTIDGDSFTPWAKEKGAEVSLKGLYWGSHNEYREEAVFTTFGDHEALPRFGIPDMFWYGRRAFSPYRELPEAQATGGKVVSAYLSDTFDDIAELMLLLRNGDLAPEQLAEHLDIQESKLKSVLNLLEVADYITRANGSISAKVLVLGHEDAEMTREMLEIGREMILSWHEANYAEMRVSLSDLTPTRNGVPFERVYTEVWHFIFALANRSLVEQGLFADPYANSRKYPGFIPAVWAKDVAHLR